jgi:hypothetical protein
MLIAKLLTMVNLSFVITVLILLGHLQTYQLSKLWLLDFLELDKSKIVI